MHGISAKWLQAPISGHRRSARRLVVVAKEDAETQPEPLRELLEVGIGLTILGLRQVNVTRRSIVEEFPQVEPIVDLAIDMIEATATPASQVLAAAAAATATVLPEPHRERLERAAPAIAKGGPELLRLSGLTVRT